MTSQGFQRLSFSGFLFHNLNCLNLSNELSQGSLNGKSVHFIAASTIVGLYGQKNITSELNANILIADSRPISTYLKVKDSSFKGARGTDFMRNYLRLSKDGYFLIGSTLETVKSLIAEIELINPHSRCVGFINPKFKDTFDNDIDAWAELIRDSGAKTVWVGMGSPKQDYISVSLAKIIDVPVLAVGAAFDFISGEKMEAPRFLQYTHLEWLFRLLSEPKRLWKRYTFGNLKFIGLVVRDFLAHLVR